MGWLVGAQQVEVVSTHHGVLDYLAAGAGIAGVVGAIVAIFAAVIAKQSANATERTLVLMENEAETLKRLRERQAKIGIELTIARVEPGRAQPAQAAKTRPASRPKAQPPLFAVLSLEIFNGGTRPTQELIASLALPKSLEWDHSQRTGEPDPEPEGGFSSGSIDGLDGTPQDVKYWNHKVPDIPVNVGWGIAFRIEKPEAGTYRALVVTTHEDSPARTEEIWQLVIPNTGADVTLARIETREKAGVDAPDGGSAEDTDLLTV
jgi:hypothetical protein